MRYLPEVLVRVNKQATLTAMFSQSDNLAGVLSDVRIVFGTCARSEAALTTAVIDEIDVAIAGVVELFCKRMREAGLTP